MPSAVPNFQCSKLWSHSILKSEIIVQRTLLKMIHSSGFNLHDIFLGWNVLCCTTGIQWNISVECLLFSRFVQICSLLLLWQGFCLFVFLMAPNINLFLSPAFENWNRVRVSSRELESTIELDQKLWSESLGVFSRLNHWKKRTCPQEETHPLVSADFTGYLTFPSFWCWGVSTGKEDHWSQHSLPLFSLKLKTAQL